MNQPRTTGVPKPKPDADVWPGTPAGEPAKGPGILPGTPDDKRDQDERPTGSRS